MAKLTDPGTPAPAVDPPANQPWYHGLPEEMHADAQRFKTPETLLTSWREAQNDIRARPAKDAIVVPKANASLEARTAYRTAIGVPEKPESYTLEGLNLGDAQIGRSPVDSERLTAFQKVAHDLDLTQEQFTAIAKADSSVITGRFERSEAARVEAEKESDTYLKQHFGAQMDANLQALQTSFDRMMADGKDDPFVQDLFNLSVRTESGHVQPLAENGLFRRLMFQLKGMTGSDRFIDPRNRRGGENGATPKDPTEVGAEDLSEADLQSIYGTTMSAPA